MSLWTSQAIATATAGTVSTDFTATGVAYDSREVGPGDLFVALKGESTDGHRFVGQAFAQGAAAVLVSDPVDGPHVRVADTTAALDALGAAARARTAARIIGVTGSVGKTGTKEALFACLDRTAPGRAHRSLKSYNNHVGVPLSLSRMAADTRFGIFEMGMNHAGELAQLTQLVRPHVAIVTAIAPAHRAFFASDEEIADAKGEIFAGLEPGGVALVPYDSAHRDRLIAAAEPYAARIVTFGLSKEADVHPDYQHTTDKGTLVSARVGEIELTFTLAPPGDHWLANAMAVLGAVQAVGGDLAAAGLALAELPGLPGRGRRLHVPIASGEALLIDESYNANPASMAATLAVLGRTPGRRIAVLGDMKELGEESPAFHAALAAPLAAAGVSTAILVGENMAALAEALEGRADFAHVPDAARAIEALKAMLAPGDAVLVKGSNSMGLSRVVAALAPEDC
ncbi:UDP-N-acetylmuramoyl-tripeptide--D-alanyl-D-alanine ligase [Sphingomonas naphthae]|uniref:UDP-N-acetylmuramoyl-tripeptide--D-alanyl-D-alanine ligase n=1 Tax=Sphingomonas naphthae TaxID=1813468 RepID=A0ABY7TNQ0_9SPHN|nr:UDP-N-acetylmuramoyl-tripeptide--D-alanyl-D-alanine ligase [Sphingomonas naphthae]WCT74020.1 UDP-N-acetylmuramoyl-tripeptide--D-alanyl-D-alanine ligase [Sphingomonas naphthae]